MTITRVPFCSDSAAFSAASRHKVPPKKLPFFKVGKELKEKVNSPK